MGRTARIVTTTSILGVTLTALAIALAGGSRPLALVALLRVFALLVVLYAAAEVLSQLAAVRERRPGQAGHGSPRAAG